MGVEREYKFDVDPDWPAPDLGRLAGGAEPMADQRLVSTYFDTTDHRLWAEGMTLRHRGEAGGQEGGKWTLKRPRPDDAGDSGASVRTELEWEGSLDDMPPEVAGEVAGVTRGEALAELAVLSSWRRRVRLGGERAWAEMDDDSVTVTSGPRPGMRFRQVEVELLADPPVEALEAVLSALAQAGATPGGGSKIGMAAGLEPPAGGS